MVSTSGAVWTLLSSRVCGSNAERKPVVSRDTRGGKGMATSAVLRIWFNADRYGSTVVGGGDERWRQGTVGLLESREAMHIALTSLVCCGVDVSRFSPAQCMGFSRSR